jgi:hypothetical protein
LTSFLRHPNQIWEMRAMCDRHLQHTDIWKLFSLPQWILNQLTLSMTSGDTEWPQTNSSLNIDLKLSAIWRMENNRQEIFVKNSHRQSHISQW